MKSCEVCKKEADTFPEKGICLRCYIKRSIELRKLDILESSTSVG